LQHFQSFTVFGLDLLNDPLVLRTYSTSFYNDLSGLFIFFFLKPGEENMGIYYYTANFLFTGSSQFAKA